MVRLPTYYHSQLHGNITAHHWPYDPDTDSGSRQREITKSTKKWKKANKVKHIPSDVNIILG